MDKRLCFLIAMLVGFVFPDFSPYLMKYIRFFLVLLMYFSLLDLTFTWDISAKDMATAFFLNYVVLGGFLIMVGSFLDTAYFQGIVIMAVMPPPAAVLSFTYFLGGDLKLSLVSESFLYLMSFFIAPLVIFLFFGERVNYIDFLKMLIEFILVPILLVYLTSKTRIYVPLKKRKDPLITLFLSLTMYIMIGINRSAFFMSESFYLFIIGFLKSFLIGFTTFYLFKNAGAQKRISYTLISASKNYALAAVIALKLFGTRAGLPSIIAIPFDLMFFFTLTVLIKKQ